MDCFYVVLRIQRATKKVLEKAWKSAWAPVKNEITQNGEW